VSAYLAGSRQAVLIDVQRDPEAVLEQPSPRSVLGHSLG
jgi:hypothetical protein